MKYIINIFLLTNLFLFLLGELKGQVPNEEIQSDVNNLLRLQLVGGSGADEMVVYFDTMATNNYDINYDAIKFLSETAGVPNIYTKVDTLKLSINVLKRLNQDMVIPMGIITKTAGIYQVNVIDISTFNPSSTVYLEDRYLGIFTNLRNISQYNVNLPVGEYNGRFFIHFHPPIEITIINETCNQNDGQVTINNPSTEQNWNISLLSYDGQVISQSSDSNTIFNNLTDGGYIIRISDSSGYMVDQPIYIEPGQVLEGNIILMGNNYYTTDLIEASVSQIISGVSYKWYLNGQLVGVESEISLNITEPGVYELMLEISNTSCILQTTTNFAVIQVTIVGDKNVKITPEFIIYPNPVFDILYVQIDNKLSNILYIFDSSGRLVYSEILNKLFKQTIQLNLNNLPSGLYRIIIEGNKKINYEKMVYKSK
jgi:hypothetical protein